MGRWDDNDQPTGGGWGRKIGGGRTNRIRTTKRLIMIGLVTVAAIVLTIFLSRGGLYIDIIQREEGMGTLQTITVRLSNNNFNSLDDVTVQFGEDGKVQTIGNMGAFSSITITPPPEDMDFENIIVRANYGQVQVVKSR
ncbi:MAG TPA: hypothetical protein VGW09_11270 [Nitrososphaeraceae archaeon]|nr:hypothetical protein [Nitrososphaeraceae archaeon]